MSDQRGKVAVGIDLGTTRSVIAYLDNTGRPFTVQNLEGDATTPSVVFFDQSDIVIGKEALKVAEFEPDRVAQFAKRHLGKEAFSIEVAGRHFPPEVIQALILKKLKDDATHRLGPIDKCVVTVPAYFNEPRRKATQDAGRMAGLNVVDIINEPTAAALAYGVQQGFVNAEGRTEELETVLVYDLGGGTFDVTLMEIEGNDYRAIGTAGDVYLGGIDWDERIADHVAEQFQIQHGVDPRKDPSSQLRLLAEAEDAKRSLSQREEVTIRFTADANRVQVPINREQFESMCGDLIDRTMFTTRRVLKEADRSWHNLSRLLLVGGSSRMPMVQNMLEAESGLKVDRSLSADESVGHGAAIYAGILLNADTPSKNRISVSNVNSHDLGIMGVDAATGFPRRSVMIDRNTALPVRKAKRFSTGKVGQKSVAVNVVEGGDEQGRHSTAVGKCVVRDLPDELPKGTPVDVIFNYKVDGRLEVLAQLPSIKRKAALTIERGSGLSDAEIGMWKKRIDEGILKFEDDSPIEETEPVPMPVKTKNETGPSAEKVTTQTTVPVAESVEPSDVTDQRPDFSFTEPAVPEPPEPSPAPPKTEKPANAGWKSRRKQVQAGDDE